jgi:hypothetical protein
VTSFVATLTTTNDGADPKWLNTVLSMPSLFWVGKHTFTFRPPSLFCAYAQYIKSSIQLSSETLDNPALLKYGVEVVEDMLFKVLCIFIITLYTSKSSLGIILLSV